MVRLATPTADDVRLEEPDFYPHADGVYTWLRDEHPVFYYEPLDLFAVSRYDDIRNVAGRPREFSSAHGLLLTEYRFALMTGESLIDGIFDPADRFLEHVDPPEHRQLRNLLAPWFSPRAVAARKQLIDDLCTELLDSVPTGAPFDFIQAVAARLPVLLIARMLGLPQIDVEQVLCWNDALESLSAGAQTRESVEAATATFASLREFLLAEFSARRHSKSDDLITGLLHQELDGQPIRDSMAFVYISALLASTDTSRSLLTGLVQALAEHPAQWAALRRDPGLAMAATDEALRWVTPARGFGRTAVVDTNLGGVPILSGQRVYLLFESGNRDPRVFPAPDQFDIARRHPAPHLSFGTGPHICLAAQLVRLEAATLLEAMIRRYREIQVVREPTRVTSVLRNGWESLWMQFEPLS